MRMQYLEEYLELAGTMSYTAAAHRLNLTSSALSKHVMALEQEFGATFVDRSRQQIELTPQGRAFCEEASKMLEAYRDAYRRVHATGAEVRVAGALRDSAVRRLLAGTQEALRDAPESPCLVQREIAATGLHDALACGQVDLVIDVRHGDVEEVHGDAIDCCPLISVPLLAVVGAGSPLAGRESLHVADLADQRIMHPTGSMSMQGGATVIEEVFRAHGVDMRKHIFYASTWDDFATADFSGSVFVMPRTLFNRQLLGGTFDDYRAIPIVDEDARFPYWLDWRRDERNSAVLRYIDALRAAASR